MGKKEAGFYNFENPILNLYREIKGKQWGKTIQELYTLIGTFDLYKFVV